MVYSFYELIDTYKTPCISCSGLQKPEGFYRCKLENRVYIVPVRHKDRIYESVVSVPGGCQNYDEKWLIEDN